MRGNRHGFGSVHDVEDMWLEANPDERSTASHEFDAMEAELAAEYEDATRRIIYDGPITPFYQLLPETLQHLRILDDINTESVACFVDEQLSDLVLDPKFSQLRDIQVRRKKIFTEHIKPEQIENSGWRIERRELWNIMRRV